MDHKFLDILSSSRIVKLTELNRSSNHQTLGEAIRMIVYRTRICKSLVCHSRVLLNRSHVFNRFIRINQF